jgi:hypothetical protein
MRLPPGSILERVPFLSVIIHTASVPAAMAPSLSATGAEIREITAFVAASTRSTRPSWQLGDQMLPNPTAKPEQGDLLTGMVATRSFLLGSILSNVFCDWLEIQTA